MKVKHCECGHGAIAAETARVAAGSGKQEGGDDFHTQTRNQEIRHAALQMHIN